MVYKEINTKQFFKPQNEGDILEGKMIKKDIGKDDNSIFCISNKDGEFWIGGKVIADSLNEIALNTKVRLTFMGTAISKTLRVPYNKWKIEVDA